MAWMAAVASTARHSQCSLAAAAACHWRRRLSGGGGISKSELERIVKKKLPDILDKEIMVQVLSSPDIEEAIENRIGLKIRDSPLISSPYQGLHLMVKNSSLKHAMDMQQKLNEQRIAMSTKLNDARLKVSINQNILGRLVDAFCFKCEMKSVAAEHTEAVIEDKHQSFENDLSARIIQAEISLVKGIAYVISVPGTLATMYYRIKGGR